MMLTVWLQMMGARSRCLAQIMAGASEECDRVAMLQLVEVDMCTVHVSEEVLQASRYGDDELASRLVPELVSMRNALRQVHEASGSSLERV